MNLKITMCNTIVRGQKQLESVEYFNCLGSLIACDPRCMLEIKFRIAMANAAFNKKKILVDQQIRFKFKEETDEMLCFYHSFK